MRQTSFQIQSRALVATALAALMAAACSREPEAAPVAPAEPTVPMVTASGPQTVYACDSGKSVSIGNPDPATVQVTYQGKTQVLTTAGVASGARYVGTGLEWRTAASGDRETGTLTQLDAQGQPGAVLERCSRPATAPIRPAPCTGGQLKLTLDGGDAGMGHRLSTLGLTNTGSAACVVEGYPAVAVLDKAAAPLANVVIEQGPNNYLSSNPTGTGGAIVVATGGKAVFDLTWTVVPNEGEGETVCPTATALRVSPAGGGAPLTLAQTFTPCGGRVQVTPLRAADAKPR